MTSLLCVCLCVCRCVCDDDYALSTVVANPKSDSAAEESHPTSMVSSYTTELSAGNCNGCMSGNADYTLLCTLLPRNKCHGIEVFKYAIWLFNDKFT